MWFEQREPSTRRRGAERGGVTGQGAAGVGAAGHAGQGPGPPQPLPFGFGVFPPARLTGRVPGLNRRAGLPRFSLEQFGPEDRGRARPRSPRRATCLQHTSARPPPVDGTDNTAQERPPRVRDNPESQRHGTQRCHPRDSGRAAPWSHCHPRWPAPRDLTTAQHTRALRAGRAWASQSVPKRGSSESMLTRSRAATGGRASYRGTGVPAEQSGLGQRWLLSGRHTCFMACAHTRALCVSACTFASCARPTQDRVCSQNEQAFKRILFTLVNRGLPWPPPSRRHQMKPLFRGQTGP